VSIWSVVVEEITILQTTSRPPVEPQPGLKLSTAEVVSPECVPGTVTSNGQVQSSLYVQAQSGSEESGIVSQSSS